MTRFSGRGATATDLETWRALVEACRGVAAEPALAPRAAFGRLVTTARRHTAAPGVLWAENACVVLVRLAGRFDRETTRGRCDLAADLIEAADKAAAQLDAFQGRGRLDG